MTLHPFSTADQPQAVAHAHAPSEQPEEEFSDEDLSDDDDDWLLPGCSGQEGEEEDTLNNPSVDTKSYTTQTKLHLDPKVVEGKEKATYDWDYFLENPGKGRIPWPSLAYDVTRHPPSAWRVFLLLTS